MIEIETDLDILMKARDRVTYGDYHNTIVEWTIGWSDTDRLVVDIKKFRGCIVFEGRVAVGFESGFIVTGELSTLQR